MHHLVSKDSVERDTQHITASGLKTETKGTVAMEKVIMGKSPG